MRVLSWKVQILTFFCIMISERGKSQLVSSCYVSGTRGLETRLDAGD
jgi:hypothetical protein